MNDEFEHQLRRALRPVDAPEGFAERLMSRLPGKPTPVVVALPAPAAPAVTAATARRSRNFTVPAALAASLVAAVMLGQHMAGSLESHRQERELAEGRAASRELMEALRVTSQKLDMAYQAVNGAPQPAAEEENPS